MDDENRRVHNWSFAGPVERAYEYSRAPVAMIVGPTGGGKSTGSARRCLRVATWQHASPRDGVRRARILCICPTYRRAWDTVMPSYFKVFPQSLGDFRGSRGDPADHIFDMNVSIGGQPARVHVETLFRAVNDLDIEEFFRGFEFTAIWLPEADTNKDLRAILSLGSNRVGRYPEPEDRPIDPPAEAYRGIWGDANAPMIGTHFHERFYLKRTDEKTRAPETDRLFVQPGGFSPNAENMANLRRISGRYYENMAAQLDEYDKRRLIDNQPGYGRHGKPVHPNFDPITHVATRDLEPDPFSPIYIGVDAGSGALTPAATFNQVTYAGQWRTFDEIFIGKGQLNTEEFGQAIREKLNSRFGQQRIDAITSSGGTAAMICGDPAMASKGALTAYSTGLELQHHSGVEVQLAPTNDPKARRTAVDKLFRRMIAPREPAKIIDPRCIGLIQGYSGGFHYQRRGAIVSPSPAKNEFSHVCEADEYAPLTVEGMDAATGPFIRQAGQGGEDAPMSLLAP